MRIRFEFVTAFVLLAACASALERSESLERREFGRGGSARIPRQRDRIPLPPPLVPLDRPTCRTTTGMGETLELIIEAPLPGGTSSSYEPDCPTQIQVNGTAILSGSLFDFYFVLDSSGSTGRCSGEDINGNGTVGIEFFPSGCSDPGDTVLAAEVAAVRGFILTLDPARARVAIIQFSMPEGSTFGSRQRIVQSLTSDFALVNAALDEVLTFGSAGATDYGGGLELLRVEYVANSAPATRRQYSYFMSDGVPTYPDGGFGSEEPGDSQAGVDGADVLAALGLRVDTFGVGFIPSMTLDPILPPRCLVDHGGVIELASTLECIALRTGGEFFESSNPADIIDQLGSRIPTGIESVFVFNDTNGTSVEAVLGPNGTYTADLGIEQGVVNHLRVVVTSDDGTTCEASTDFLALCFAAGCSPLTQGYWHRQCLGLGLIPSNGNMPPHPDWDPEILLRIMRDIVDPQVAQLGSPIDQTACEGLDADPPSDMCQKAIKQYTAVLMNMAGGRLGPACVLELDELGFVAPEDARNAIAAAIQAGLAGDDRACVRANDWADAINTGSAVR